MATAIDKGVREAHKWATLYGVFFSDALVYRANAIVWLMTDAVPAVIMPLIWLSSFNGRATINGFSPSRIVVYYVAILFLSCVVESHVMWDIAGDIKQGKFNVYLTRPYPYIFYCGAANLSWRLMRSVMFIPIFAGVLFLFHKWVTWDSRMYHFGWEFWLAVLLGHVLSFCISYALGLVALWVIETQSLYHMYYLPLIIFNGQIAPLSFFPKAVRDVAMFLPFNYTLGFPAQIFVGSLPEKQIMMGFAIQIAWIAIAAVGSVIAWRGGLKRYTSYGI